MNGYMEWIGDVIKSDEQCDISSQLALEIGKEIDNLCYAILLEYGIETSEEEIKSRLNSKKKEDVKFIKKVKRILKNELNSKRWVQNGDIYR